MQRPALGFRGGVRMGHHRTRTHHAIDDDDDDDELIDPLHPSLSNSNNSDEKGDDGEENQVSIRSTRSTVYKTMTAGGDFEAAIRNLRPSTIRQKLIKTNLNISKQKADLPQLNIVHNDENGTNEQKREDIEQQTQNNHEDKPARRWFPKPDVGHVDSNVFIRHNHVVVENQQTPETIDQSTPPALLTAVPPEGISTRPTAIIAPAAPLRSVSAFFSATSTSTSKRPISNSFNDLHIRSPLSSTPQQPSLPSSLVPTASSAFQPINPAQTTTAKVSSTRTSATRSAPVLMDVPQHKALERGQQLTKVHISHPQSPSIVHLMLHEDFETACRLLHEMTAHPELQPDYIPTQSFKLQVNRLCACFHEGRWFRCRILQVASDLSTATVVYLDWGMIISMQTGPTLLRRLPNEFYVEPACSIMCHLDGVPDTNDLMPPDIIAQCIALLSENEYDVSVNGYDSTTGGKVVLSVNGRIINDQICQLLMPNTMMSPEQELVEQFRHELPLAVGDELKALLSSFSGKDDSFYVLLINENTVAIDRAMSQLQENNLMHRRSVEITPRAKTLVVARYADDGKWYRAWIKSISVQRHQAIVFFVDFGNESTVSFDDIYPCPESVRTLPWLGIRVRLTAETMSHDELATFWKIAESNYVWIRILEILSDAYGIQIKLDYTVFLRHERLKGLTMNDTNSRLVHASVQTALEKLSMPISPEMSSLATDHSQLASEALVRSLFEMIANELRRLRHRVNDSDESSQDRHSQLMQLLLATTSNPTNTTNSISQKKL